MTLSLAEASSIVDAAIMKARQLDVTVCVAVCDRLGSLIALNRMDGAYETINRYSVGKAVVSAGTGLPSGDVVGIVDHPPVATAVAEGLPRDPGSRWVADTQRRRGRGRLRRRRRALP